MYECYSFILILLGNRFKLRMLCVERNYGTKIIGRATYLDSFVNIIKMGEARKEKKRKSSVTFIFINRDILHSLDRINEDS